MNIEKYISELNYVSETLLVPIYFRAKETIENGLIKDDYAVKIIKQIKYNFRRMDDDRSTQILIALRTKILDQIVSKYILQVKSPIIINLGAGLDTRHLRFSRSIKWYQLDLEPPMKLRSFFFGEEGINIIKNILDFSWIKDIIEKENVLILIEGVLMYLEKEQVMSIFEAIGLNFSNSYIAFDTIPVSYTNMDKHKSIDIQRSPFKWGNDSLSEIEEWNYGFKGMKKYEYLSDMPLTVPFVSKSALDETKGNVVRVNVMQIN